MRSVLLVILLLWCSLIVAQSLNFNELDSFGLKHGLWHEYKLLPSKMIKNKVIDDSVHGISIYDEYDILDDPIIFTSQGSYLNGLKNGVWVERWLNDSIRSKINYFNGIAIGKFEYFYPDGVLMMEGIINISEYIDVKAYDKQGEFIGLEREKTKIILEFLYLK